MTTTVLIIDDEAGIRETLGAVLEDEHYRVLTAADGVEGLAMARSERPDVILLDVLLPNMGGLDVLRTLKQEDDTEAEIIMISGHATIDMAVKALKTGAFDFLEKPISLERVLALVRNAARMERLQRENRKLRSSLPDYEELIGETEGIKRIREIVRQTAGSDARALITGENGTGKEVVARTIHRSGRRSAKPFVAVNCAAIPESLIESELFGHEKGAFTSAVGRRRGKIELADGGTFFLDEIADLSASAQAKLLRVLQEMRFERVGGEESIDVDVRIIAATNKNLEAEVEAKRFRMDLFYRLNVVHIEIPPLRERIDDIPLFLEQFGRAAAQQADVQPREYTPEAMARIKNHPWRGNIRELKNFVERVTIMTDDHTIDADTAGEYLGESSFGEEESELDEYREMGLAKARETFERRLIESTLRESDFNVAQAAQRLGVYPSNLHAKLKKYGISREA